MGYTQSLKEQQDMHQDVNMHEENSNNMASRAKPTESHQLTKELYPRTDNQENFNEANFD